MTRRQRLLQLAPLRRGVADRHHVSLTVSACSSATTAMAAGWANVVATAVGTVPSFELNRRWVWGRRDERSLLTQVVPFCVLSFAGLGLSTLTVSLAAGVGHVRRISGAADPHAVGRAGQHRDVRPALDAQFLIL